MKVENPPTLRGRFGFKIVRPDCGSLSIKVADSGGNIGPVECARCGSVRGTLADLRDLALGRSDIFEFQSRENCK